MTIFLKNKHTLQIDDFYFKCCIGKNGVTRRKKEGDYKTPLGIFTIEELFFRKDRIKKPKTRRIIKIIVKVLKYFSLDTAFQSFIILLGVLPRYILF